MTVRLYCRSVVSPVKYSRPILDRCLYSLPVRLDRNTLRESIPIEYRVKDGFVNISEVPSGAYHQATITRAQGLRPADLSDEDDDE